MAICKGCGAEIIWIKTKSGKAMPCDPQKIPYKTLVPDRTIGQTLVLPDGRIAVGEYDADSDQYGYISHFATCPSANVFRKGRNNGKKTR